MDEYRTAAEIALSALWGGQVGCDVADTLREQGRSRVYRLAVSGGPVVSVILKAAVGDETVPYVSGDPANGPFRRFCNEWSGCQMLGPLGLGPKAYTADAAMGICLLEDLGAGETLAQKLMGDDPGAATSALFAYARSLGDMHAVTQGQGERWTALRSAIGAPAGGDPDSGPTAEAWPQYAPAFLAYCARLGGAPAGLDADLAGIGEALAHPGGYLAFTPADCCPDNHYLRGERVVFFDCEGALMRHALVDAAYFLAPFPTCWCCNRLPDGLPQRLLAAYREQFPGGADFEDQLTLALASWVVVALVRAGLMNWEAEDRPWGLATLRQRGLALLQNLLARPNLDTVLPSLAEAAAGLHASLSASWADVGPMPLYPAYRGTPAG